MMDIRVNSNVHEIIASDKKRDREIGDEQSERDAEE